MTIEEHAAIEKEIVDSSVALAETVDEYHEHRRTCLACRNETPCGKYRRIVREETRTRERRNAAIATYRKRRTP